MKLEEVKILTAPETVEADWCVGDVCYVEDHLRQRYELIIIDSPPLVPLVDGRALAELSDRIVLAVGWDQTPQDVVSHTIDMLGPVHDRILGTVLTRVDLSRLRFYDYYRSSAYLKPYGAAGLRQGATT